MTSPFATSPPQACGDEFDAQEAVKAAQDAIDELHAQRKALKDAKKYAEVRNPWGLAMLDPWGPGPCMTLGL